MKLQFLLLAEDKNSVQLNNATIPPPPPLPQESGGIPTSNQTVLPPPAPPPPPPPQLAVTDSNDRTALLSSIQGFNKGVLKKAETKDCSVPKV